MESQRCAQGTWMVYFVSLQTSPLGEVNEHWIGNYALMRDGSLFHAVQKKDCVRRAAADAFVREMTGPQKNGAERLLAPYRSGCLKFHAQLRSSSSALRTKVIQSFSV